MSEWGAHSKRPSWRAGSALRATGKASQRPGRASCERPPLTATPTSEHSLAKRRLVLGPTLTEPLQEQPGQRAAPAPAGHHRGWVPLIPARPHCHPQCWGPGKAVPPECQPRGQLSPVGVSLQRHGDKALASYTSNERQLRPVYGANTEEIPFHTQLGGRAIGNKVPFSSCAGWQPQGKSDRTTSKSDGTIRPIGNHGF